MTVIQTTNAPAAVGPYSQAVVSGGFVFTSGQLPLDPASGTLVSRSIRMQTEQAIANLRAVLEASDSSLDRVFKTTCYLTNLSDFAAFNEVYASYFPHAPARSCVEVSALPRGAAVEIEAVALLAH